MSIASAIQNAQQKVANSYTAISNKGGTLPATQNLSNMPTAIASIPSGITPTGTISITTNGTTDVTNYATANVNVVSRKYGASIDTFLGNVDANGVLQPSVEMPDLLFTGVTDVASYGLYYRFVLSRVKSVSFPNLTTISGSNGCYYMFSACTSLTDVYFPALTTTSFGSNVNQFNSMLATTGNTTTHTLHFPSNLESTISNLTGYPLFGGTSGYVVCAFDLPATS